MIQLVSKTWYTVSKLCAHSHIDFLCLIIHQWCWIECKRPVAGTLLCIWIWHVYRKRCKDAFFFYLFNMYDFVFFFFLQWRHILYIFFLNDQNTQLEGSCQYHIPIVSPEFNPEITFSTKFRLCVSRRQSRLAH